MSWKAFMQELNGNRVEGELIITLAYSLLTALITLVILAFLYTLHFLDFAEVREKYQLFIFFSTLSYALITPTLRQVRAYKELPCMSGMMVGMTTGMIASFLPGFYVASTNGMFIGGFFGVALGLLFGIWNGKCCGVMGIIEGIMAGFMGGLMGAMTAFMLLNDNLRSAAVLVFLISTVIISSLNYMIYKEMRETERQRKESHVLTILLTVVLVLVTTMLMVLGPRSAIFQ